MRYQFYREHKYVSSALNDLERVIARTDFCDAAALEKVREGFQDLAGMLKGHAEYENSRLHTLLRRKNSPIYAHVEEDHTEQDRQLLKIEAMIQGLSQEADQKQKVNQGYHLYLTYRKFVADNLVHLHEEETIILPELQRLYSDEELQQVEAHAYGEMTPEQMVSMIEVLFPHMNTHDKQAFLSDILALEPRKFDIVWKMIQSNLSENERMAMELLI